MNKILLLTACCVISAAYGGDEYTTHKDWRNAVRGASTPHTAAKIFCDYQEFAKKNPNVKGKRPKASDVHQKFEESMRALSEDPHALAGLFMEKLEFTRKYPDNPMSTKGVGDDSQPVHMAFYMAFLKEGDPAKKAALFALAKSFADQYPSQSGSPWMSPVVDLSKDVHKAFFEAMEAEKDPFKKAAIFEQASDFGKKYNDRFGPFGLPIGVGGKISDVYRGVPQHALAGLSVDLVDRSYHVHDAFRDAIRKAEGDSNRFVQLYQAWELFNTNHPSRREAYSPSFPLLKAQYDWALDDLKPTSSAPKAASSATRAAASMKPSWVVNDIVMYCDRYYELPKPTSQKELHDTFTEFCKKEGRRLTPSSALNKEVARAKLRELQADYDWVSGLTEQEFQKQKSERDEIWRQAEEVGKMDLQ